MGLYKTFNIKLFKGENKIEKYLIWTQQRGYAPVIIDSCDTIISAKSSLEKRVAKDYDKDINGAKVKETKKEIIYSFEDLETQFGITKEVIM